MVEINVIGGVLSQEEKTAYIKRGKEVCKNSILTGIDVKLDGDYVDLIYHTKPIPFERIRRITGYLVGDMSRWNNGKAAEESDRVKHNVNLA